MIVSPMTCVENICTGSFTASGPAVNAGWMCETGAVYDTITRAAGFQSGKIGILRIHKLFVCSDGSGTFEMNMMVRLADNTTARWNFSGGEGDYAGLVGSGSLTGGVCDTCTVLDTYWGKINIP